jgi:hypothetical protein
MTVPRRTVSHRQRSLHTFTGVRTACMLGHSGEIQMAATGRTARAPKLMPELGPVPP